MPWRTVLGRLSTNIALGFVAAEMAERMDGCGVIARTVNARQGKMIQTPTALRRSSVIRSTT